VVIEEYQAPAHARPSRTVTPEQPAVVVLSAKNVERLREQARQLLAAIGHNGWGDERLAELAYTLQVGRDAMEERLAMPVHSMAQLQEKLAAFVAGEEGIEGLYRGQLKRNKEALAVFTADEELQEAIAKWVERKKYAKVLDLWVKGLVFDWSALYGKNRPQRMSLPSYAFARERYWVTQTETTGAGAAQAMNKQAMASHDESFYHDMLDRVMDGSMSVEAAVREMK
jgi:acyl transferase domain-containing protein